MCHRISAVSRNELLEHLEPWIDARAIDAMLDRRGRITTKIDNLVVKQGRPQVVIP